MRYWEGEKITKLKGNQVFVFGSNPEGRHGAGAAKVAMKLGAVYGNGRGYQGQSYALVTKNLTKDYLEVSSEIQYEREGMRSITKPQILCNIKELYECAETFPDKEFLIAYTHPSKNLNGYTCREMFEMFTLAGTKPNNVLFNESFKKFSVKQDRPEKMNLIVAGGRDFDNFEWGFKCIDHVTSNYDKKGITIICGRAKGGDTCGEEWYKKHKQAGVKIKYFDPDWNNLDVEGAVVKYNRYGKPYNARAGMVRNHEMGDVGTHLLALWDRQSKGTFDMITYMDSLNKPHKVFTY